MTKPLHCAYLGLGSNLGDTRQNLRRAADLIGQEVGLVTARSSVYDTEPWGFQSVNRFSNAVVCVATALTPTALLAATQRIERMMGREEKSHDGIYHDRIIDIDILTYDDAHISTPELTIPHPHMQEREFVMLPLRELTQDIKQNSII